MAPWAVRLIVARAVVHSSWPIVDWSPVRAFYQRAQLGPGGLNLERNCLIFLAFRSTPPVLATIWHIRQSGQLRRSLPQRLSDGIPQSGWVPVIRPLGRDNRPAAASTGLTATELAAITGVHIDTARRWKRAGAIPEPHAKVVDLRLHASLAPYLLNGAVGSAGVINYGRRRVTRSARATWERFPIGKHNARARVAPRRTASTRLRVTCVLRLWAHST